jgi:hypothetical protein
MFGKTKDTIKPKNVAPEVQIITIPDEFFAGADPTVRFKKTEKVVDLNKNAGTVAPNEREKRELDAVTAKGSLLTGTKVWIIGGIILFVLAVAGASLYYWWTGRQTTTPKPVVKNNPVVVTVHPTSTVVTQPTGTAPTTTVTTTPETPVVVKEPNLELPSKLSMESADVDNDGVSDAAEEIFGSDPGNPDTDADSYNDGHELYYLYNPNGIEPMKVIDSGAVKLFKSGNFNYSLYYPTNWLAASVDIEGRQMLFTTLNGEYVEARIFDMAPGQSLAEWFAAAAPSDSLSGYTDVESRFGAKGKMRSDGLVYLYVSGQRIYALVYHEIQENLVSYKKVLEVMARSFKVESAASALPSLPDGVSEFITGTSTEAASSTVEDADETISATSSATKDDQFEEEPVI